jgi:hypothetical protein
MAERNQTPITGGQTVTVASKMPMAFILKLHKKVTRHEPVMGGGTREVPAFEPRTDAPTIVIKGNSFPQNNRPDDLEISGGYALTSDVPKAFWDEWLDQNRDADFVRNGMIFAHAQRASIVSEAREKAGEKSNIERLDPANLPKGMDKIQQDKAA